MKQVANLSSSHSWSSSFAHNGSVTDNPYRLEEARPEPTACPDCGAVYQQGRWRWAGHPTFSVEQPCPACRRERDRQPAGTVLMTGRFFARRRLEIFDLIWRTEFREKAAHPLQRVMGARDTADGWELSTTHVRLARAIGKALQAAHGGTLDVAFSAHEYRVRVHWRC